MNEVANQLAQSLFKKNTLQECSRWELEILADKYPYFGIAQLLLAGKLHEENNEAYQKQLQKTSLYFTNPLWLDYTLNSELGKAEKQAGAMNGSATTDTSEIVSEEHVRFAPKVEEQRETESIIPEIENIIAAPIEVTEELITTPVETSLTENKIVETIGIPEESAATDMPEVSQQTEMPKIVAIDADPIKEDAEETTSPVEITQEAELKIAPLKLEPMPDADAPLVFEALHTVDYFASQGIKLKLDEIPKDKFGQQLKSFTEWLKTLKKTPASEISKQVDKSSEQKVVTLAEHSLENRDVLTEAMAEVWAKQGNKAKAIEVYNKLSLQNPAKSSYFAALIEQLKQS